MKIWPQKCSDLATLGEIEDRFDKKLNKVPTEKQTRIVYTIITCSNCDVQYIGGTGRHLQTRRRVNERSVRDNKIEHVQ